MTSTLSPVLLADAFAARTDWLAQADTDAFRLFNGFTEGFAGLALDVFGSTLVVHDYSEQGDTPTVDLAVEAALKHRPSLKTVLLKTRHSTTPALKNGHVIVGDQKALARKVRELGVTYALDLTLNRDTSLYLDTRAVRRWAKQHLSGARVLNCFAYTGSLGVAARAAGAQNVIHCDLNKNFLQVAKDSYSMNSWPISRADFRAQDFFDVVGGLKRDDFLFDCVFVDPPFFARSAKGTVDVSTELKKLINKVRPLVAHDGRLVLVNNALFVSGEAFLNSVNEIVASGYTELETRLDVDADFARLASEQTPNWPTPPAPFNHSTKVVVLRITRKDERKT